MPLLQALHFALLLQLHSRNHTKSQVLAQAFAHEQQAGETLGVVSRACSIAEAQTKSARCLVCLGAVFAASWLQKELPEA